MIEELKILRGDYIIEILIKYIQLNIESVIAIDVIYFCSERTYHLPDVKLVLWVPIISFFKFNTKNSWKPPEALKVRTRAKYKMRNSDLKNFLIFFFFGLLVD